ncbi:MAG: phosphoribosylamine--glycine ligase [Opitutales bacterium]|nr:phosphoribosylamine--glycine ligase [Opitutales bacterium]
MQEEPVRTLILGGGGREHALYLACKASPLCGGVVVAPGNGGIPAGDCRPVDLESVAAMVNCARQAHAGLVIVGPEAPLALGVADALRSEGFAVYGPDEAGARLEASKAHCKAFLDRHGIPTAAYERFTEAEAALAHLKDGTGPVVVKASGLAAGKGVYVCADRAEAEAAVREIMVDRVFGTSGEEVVFEECLEGPEVSIMVMVSGTGYVCLPPSQDHKRAGEGDTGPNTGGMGAYAPAAVVTPELKEVIDQTIVAPSVAGLARDGLDYRGTLYIGLMLTAEGPKVLEFNVRFGDPECQVLLPLCAHDPLDLMLRCARGENLPAEVVARGETAAVIVVAAKGYPGPYAKGEAIRLPPDVPAKVHIVHAGTRRGGDGALLSTGGRVLGVVARAPDLARATSDAYAVCDRIDWPGKVFRRDIGWRQLQAER